MNLFLYMYLFTDRCMHSLNKASFFYWLFVVKKKKDFGFGVRALNLTVQVGSGRVGSDDLGYGPGSGFSLKPVQTSNVTLVP